MHTHWRPHMRQITPRRSQVLRSLGLQPHMLACRSTEPLEASVRDKLALFCQVPPDSVLGMHDVSNIWQVRLTTLLVRERAMHSAPVERYAASLRRRRRGERRQTCRCR